MLRIGSWAGFGVLKKAEEGVEGELGAEYLIASEDSSRNSDVGNFALRKGWSQQGRIASAAVQFQSQGLGLEDFQRHTRRLNAEIRGLAL
jgi:hypothetical protein